MNFKLIVNHNLLYINIKLFINHQYLTYDYNARQFLCGMDFLNIIPDDIIE